MREIFSEEHRHQLWRRIWVALARAEHRAGLVSKAELADLEKHQANLDIARILEIEGETRHDVVAAIREFAGKAKVGGGKIHLGATSMDIVDNAETVRLKEALALAEKRLAAVLGSLANQIEHHAGLACLGYTHLQPAEPTTVGYRLAYYGQELLAGLTALQDVQAGLLAKGLKGAVGTAASYAALLKGTKLTPEHLERQVMEELGLTAAPVSSQVSPRTQEYQVLTTLNLVAAPLAKFGGDLRILQSAAFGEWSEPFGKKQVGSSAMPFKKNPINAEKICSLARVVAAQPAVALENASLSYLERTLDDSANRRVIVPEAFLALDELLLTAEKVIGGLIVHQTRVAANLDAYAPFAATEAILLAAVQAGADRQAMHETLREISLTAWQDVQAGKPNPMPELLAGNTELTKFVSASEITKLLDVRHHLGVAPARAKATATTIRKTVRS
jgi:adenylosuccinate lyase